MSQENVERMHRAFDAFARRDKDAWLELADLDLEVAPVGDWPETDPIRGAEAAWEFLVAADEPWERGPYGLVEVIDGDDKVVANQRRDLRGKSSGVEVEYDHWLVLTVRDGKPSALSGSRIAKRPSKPPGCGRAIP
jgi:ketosteroid isomerase-like protein